MTQGSTVHVRRTIVVEYDVDRADYEAFTDAQVVAYETEPHGQREGWSILDYDDEHITSSSAKVTFK